MISLLFLRIRFFFERFDYFGSDLVIVEFFGLWLCLFIVDIVCIYGSGIKGDVGFNGVEWGCGVFVVLFDFFSFMIFYLYSLIGSIFFLFVE